MAGGLTGGGGGGGVRCFRAVEEGEGACWGKRSLEARLVKKARLRRVAGWVEEREEVGGVEVVEVDSGVGDVEKGGDSAFFVGGGGGVVKEIGWESISMVCVMDLKRRNRPFIAE